MKHDHTIKLLNQERDEQFRLRLEVEEERDMLADENRNLANHLLAIGYSINRVDAVAKGFDDDD